jgi:hypothetical protein
MKHIGTARRQHSSVRATGDDLPGMTKFVTESQNNARTRLPNESALSTQQGTRV